MTRIEKTKSIRKALKALGWTNRQVSVRGVHWTANSGTIGVMIKDLSIPIDVVRKIAMKHEKIARCPISGDILLGGNTYVDVGYDHDALAAAVAELDATLGTTMEGVELGVVKYLDDGWAIWEGAGLWLAHPRRLDIGTPAVSCYDRHFCAKQIVILRLDEASKSGADAA